MDEIHSRSLSRARHGTRNDNQRGASIVGAPDLIREPAPDLIREPAPDLIREPAPDLIRESAPDLIREPAPDLIREPAPDLIRGLSHRPPRCGKNARGSSEPRAWRKTVYLGVSKMVTTKSDTWESKLG